MGLFDFLKKDKSDVEQYYEERNIQNTSVNIANKFKAPEPINNCSTSVGFQFNVDDVFTISGRGTVATGKVASGEISVGDTVTLVQQNEMSREVTVVGIEMFRKMLDTARAGDKIGLLLRDVNRGEIQRGDKLIK